MADKAISELVSAEQITATDMFVLEQNGTAKKLTGQILLNWLTKAADGHGGIQSSVLLKTVGLTDTYRFTLADQTFIDIDVKNGRSILGISPTSTNGLAVTYTARYNDDTTSTFTVTNGAKGDKGDDSHTWFKYASQEPTADSHSIGDIMDNWMGIYSGNLATAPTDWTAYQWFKIKGEKGDTGAPATLVSATVTYQVGDSGTIIPSGNWGTSIPVVAQGKYLWTRKVTQFNTGNPITEYSVSRMGMDGLGSVVSVAGISPDSTGNVPLTAKDIKALPTAGGDMLGPINMNGQPISGLNDPTENTQPATKGYVENLTWIDAATAANVLEALGLTPHYASANGSSASLSLPAGTITQLTLDTWKSRSDTSFTFSGGGIKMPFSGTVLILAAVYHQGPELGTPRNVGSYVRLNGTEVAGIWNYVDADSAIAIAPFICGVSAGDILTLHGRDLAGGSCHPANTATALTVIYM